MNFFCRYTVQKVYIHVNNSNMQPSDNDHYGNTTNNCEGGQETNYKPT